MIDRQEVMDFSREFGLASNVIEKDYVLGWMLAGIAAHPEIGQSWVFKGGTCLKKCFFETYRFSEDLDFTLTNPEHLAEPFLLATFNQISEWIYDQAGIEVPAEAIRFEVYLNPRGKASAEGRLGYRGPMQRRGDAPRIKLDLTDDELLVLEPAIREVHHPYSDRPADGIHVRCYSFEEVFAEKIRALAERERPRDLYDVIHLFRHDELRPDRLLVFSTLEQKCAFKGIAVPTMQTVDNQPARLELEAEWGNMLAHQLPVLPAFDQFWQELPGVFDWLHGVAEKIARPSLQVQTPGAGAVDETWRPPSMSYAWHAPIPFEIIRFAAANRLCVDLTYQGTRRLIEPYSLRRTQDGNLLLYAVKHETGESRSYRVDRIQGAEATQVSFIPQYLIELTPSGVITAPPVSSRAATNFSSRVSRPRTVTPAGPRYVYECPYCGKKFTRHSRNSALKPHKDKGGYPCSGRTGYLVDTKY
ncbi:MAG: nucleotidyl transferase AbiEii/AbiGii toxin family protein [Thiobacillaceae bacterium]